MGAPDELTLPTPLEPAPAALAAGRSLLLKREDVHPLGAFKWRGALPVLARLAADGHREVVTASTGNHGAATAWAARRTGLGALVYAPLGSSETKLRRIRELGAELRLAGADLDEAKELAVADARERGAMFFEDGAEREQYSGYGAIADEIVDQAASPPAAVVVPVGNGALLGGVGARLGERASGCLRVGVVAAAAPVMKRSYEAGRPVTSNESATLADGLAVRVAIPRAVEALASACDRMLEVSEEELGAGVAAYARAGLRVEGAAAAALAALPQLGDVEGPVVLLVTGRNIDDELFARLCACG